MKKKDEVKTSSSQAQAKGPLTRIATLATLSPGRGLLTGFIGRAKAMREMAEIVGTKLRSR
jgi:hypothetical protein